MMTFAKFFESLEGTTLERIDKIHLNLDDAKDLEREAQDSGEFVPTSLIKPDGRGLILGIPFEIRDEITRGQIRLIAKYCDCEGKGTPNV